MAEKIRTEEQRQQMIAPHEDEEEEKLFGVYNIWSCLPFSLVPFSINYPMNL